MLLNNGKLNADQNALNAKDQIVTVFPSVRSQTYIMFARNYNSDRFNVKITLSLYSV